MQTFTFKCPDKLAAQLEAESLTRDMQKSDLMRRALTYYLGRKGVATKQPSVYMLSQDLCGLLKGPADLSENSDYLEGYGK